MNFRRVGFLKIEISAANIGLYFGILKTAMQIKIKLANMEITIISIPKNISEAKCVPTTPHVAISPLNIMA